MATYHITSTRGGGLYGHETRICTPGGPCHTAARDYYLGAAPAGVKPGDRYRRDDQAAARAYLSRIGRKGGAAGTGAAKARADASVGGTVRQILARVRREARADGADYRAGTGAFPLPDGRVCEVALVQASDGGYLLGTVRQYRVGTGRWRRV